MESGVLSAQGSGSFCLKTLYTVAHQIVLGLFHNFKGFTLDIFDISEVETSFVVSKVATLAQMDALVAVTVSCARLEGSNEVECHVEKLYHDTFLPLILQHMSR